MPWATRLQQKALFYKPYVQYFGKNTCTDALSQNIEHRVCSFMLFLQGTIFLRFPRLGASWARFSRHVGVLGLISVPRATRLQRKAVFYKPYVQYFETQMQHQVVFLKKVNIGFVDSCCLCKGGGQCMFSDSSVFSQQWLVPGVFPYNIGH